MRSESIFMLVLLGAVLQLRLADAVPITFGNCTPKGSSERGVCIHITNCPYLFGILNNNETDSQILSDSQCGWDNTRTGLVNRILVCCLPSQMKEKDLVTDTASANDGNGNVLPSIGTCGVMFANRIIGGVDTQLWEFPWMVLLQYKRAINGDLTFNCGGALINSRYVLTAGHCLASQKLEKNGLELHSVRLGEYDTTKDPDCVAEKNGKTTCAPNHIDIEIDERIIHESYMPNSIDQLNDIGLLRLKKSVSYTDYVKPICLPIDDQFRDNAFESYAMDISGWGKTKYNNQSAKKQKATVDVWNLGRCQDKYRSYQMHLNNTQMCAGGKLEIDTCGGDSGGPLMVPINRNKQEIFYVAGITSYGPQPCGLQGWPGVYTRTAAFVDWIQQKLKA
ncbi:spaetzle-processing enzyme-like [Drosophila tropicalis]|uniref:spaetzle-processing enzyme-like n=1 Tax=Drosophila tropicalis TaxID=46794 RepID=UPI0035ABB54F